MSMFKLTMVSATFRGRRITVFVRLPVDANGAVSFNYDVLVKLLGCYERGYTYALT